MTDQKVKAGKYLRGGWFRDRNLSLTYFICSVAASDLLFSVLLLPTQVGLGMFEKKMYHETPFSFPKMHSLTRIDIFSSPKLSKNALNAQ